MIRLFDALQLVESDDKLLYKYGPHFTEIF